MDKDTIQTAAYYLMFPLFLVAVIVTAINFSLAATIILWVILGVLIVTYGSIELYKVRNNEYNPNEVMQVNGQQPLTYCVVTA
tara:strand:- start:248 stop:496 length:249 start_codon:yes stop_codon:yes gene_type:complete